MAIELHFCKSDNSPWGFRLTGGADCDTPLTVIKVNDDSIAENAGLQVDDVIVRINDDSTAGLTHIEAHDAFLAAGPDFHIGIRRGDVVEIQNDEQNNEEVINIMETSLQKTISTDSELQQEKNVYKSIKSHITDEQIAEAISGETEFLPDQNVLGVNFNKVDLAESTVLKVINEETTETKVDLENKKWSTFLQKPKTPKVIPKKKEPEGPRTSPYRVIIKKQPKKSAEATIQQVDTSSTLLFEELNESDTPEPEEPREECEKEITGESEKEEAKLEEENEQELVEETIDEKRITDEEVSGYSEEETCASITLEEIPETVTTESSVTLEEQLAQVQQQLQALSQLPSAIQVSLDAVTQQLAKIVRATHKGEEETTAAQSVTTEDETLEQFMEGETLESLEDAEGASDVGNEANLEKANLSDISEDAVIDEDQMYKQIEDDLEISEMVEQDHVERLTLEEGETESTDNEKASQQERKLMQMEEFHQRRLEQRPTHPLTPLQRPIILPGGRRWSQPTDALPTPRKAKMTDEKICETIENYSEVLTGRLKGLTNGTFFGRGPIQLNLFTGIVLYISCVDGSIVKIALKILRKNFSK